MLVKDGHKDGTYQETTKTGRQSERERGYETGSNQASYSETSNPDVVFYTISDSRFFPGLVGLLNSLRLTGHDGNVVVCDCGLTQGQRDLLRPHCTFFEMPRELVGNPQKYKPFPYLLNPKGIVAIIDSDILVTEKLDSLVKLAQQGRICLFPDPEEDRWFEEWQKLFELSSEIRHQTYVNSGFIMFSASHWPNLLERWWNSCVRIFSHPTIYEGAEWNAPSSQSDQDALNAVLMSEIPAGAIALQPKEKEVLLQDDLERVRVINVDKLTCTFLGQRTALLHSCTNPKPWESETKVGMNNAYVHLLRRLLAGRDVAIKVPPKQLPMWLRPGVIGRAAFNGFDVYNLHGPIIISAKSRVRRLVLRVRRFLKNRIGRL